MAKTYVAICYDFDGTLSPGNMQEYGFIPKLDVKVKEFWRDSKDYAREHHADHILAYMIKMLTDAAKAGIRTTRVAFHEYGKDVGFFPGVETWFRRMNDYGASRGVVLEHYIVSSGLAEIIQGTAIASEFKKIYACSFCYDNNDVAKWPAQVVNYTTKTQYLFRINKDVEDDDNKKINEYIPERDRRIPFSRMIYLGDGETDVPCMKLIRDKGGFSIAVHAPNPVSNSEKSVENSVVRKKILSRKKEIFNAGRNVCERLFRDERINFYAAADYSEGSPLDVMVKAVIDQMAATARVESILRDSVNP